MSPPILSSAIFPDVPPVKRGKVRDLYEIGEHYLIVATDRLSAFDVILPDGIPDKGKVLNQISAFWFQRLASVVPHHMVSIQLTDVPEPFRSRPDVFAGRSMLVRKMRPLPVECVVRGYLSGSGWNDYRKSGAICGITIPSGLRESDRLPEPIFTPTTKADTGHDESITFDDVTRLTGGTVSRQLRDLSIALYSAGAAYAETRGIIIADTKFEFGLDADGRLVLIDEALTPDSSRFWPADLYQPGVPQPSFDKQFVRDYLISIKWDKTPPAPRLPGEVVATTAKKYVEALERLTGSKLA